MLLEQPADLPWSKEFAPTLIGPTWQMVDGHWFLPERSLGWEALGWSAITYQHARGAPWRYTLEQARFLLWWLAVDEHGRFLFRDGVLQRLKGWGKDPLGACLCGIEMLGPCRFSGEWGEEWPLEGQPLGVDHPDSWVQTAAVSLEQTKNTMRLFPSLFSEEARELYRLQIGREIVHALGDTRLLQAVTSSPATLEGARSTFVLRNETHLWVSSNLGHDMDAVIDRNVSKAPDGAARALSITNAFEPSEDSVGQRAREAWESMQAGRHVDTGILYDSLEAPAGALLEDTDRWVESIRGDSLWLKPNRVKQTVLDPRNPPSRSRRFWLNQITGTEDAWVDSALVDLAGRDTEKQVGEEWVGFFDGSKSDDATGLVAARVADGHLLTVGIWQKPSGAQGEGWNVDRQLVDGHVRDWLKRTKVVALWADPSHAKDENAAGYWDSIIDGWHRDFSKRLEIWPTQTGNHRHSVLWDMASPERTSQFTESAMRFATELEDGDITHDGHPALRQHMKNARRAPNRWGVSLMKEHRESARKIDLAVCAVGARMVRRLVLNKRKKRRRVIAG